jgi:spermidine synthase
MSVFMEGGHRYLTFGPTKGVWQSRVACANTVCAVNDTLLEKVDDCQPCSCDLPGVAFEDDMYTNGPMFKAIEPECMRDREGQRFDILMIGLGGGALHRRVLQSCPANTRVRTIELDANVVSVAERYFGLQQIPGISEVHIGDAMKLLTANSSQLHCNISDSPCDLSSTGDWDMVTVDCFNDDEIPSSCKSGDFLRAVRHVLKPGGILVQHLYRDWPEDPQDSAFQKKEYREVVDNYKNVFGKDRVSVKAFPADLSDIESLIFASA